MQTGHLTIDASGAGGPVIVHRDGHWTLPRLGIVKQQPLPASLLSPVLVRVVLTDRDGQSQVLWLARDSMSPDQWRRLTVLLSL